ncbi:MAG: site-specific integrase [Micrococcaceae bacterium]|nr:site-specific integrase [Micrococcaceae bacterium]
MTGTRFGEATAVTVGGVNLLSRPATVRINKAWKRGAVSDFYVGPTKTGAGKRTVALNPHLVETLIPLVAGRPGTDLLFAGGHGQRIAQQI